MGKNMDNKIILNEVVRNLQLIYNDEKKINTIIENILKNNLFLFEGVVGPKELFKRALREFLEVADGIESKVIDTRNPSLGKAKDFSSANFQFNNKSEISDDIIDNLKLVNANSQGTDLAMNLMQGPSKSLLAQWVAKDKFLANEIYEATIIPAIEKSNLSERQFLLKCRNQSKDQGITLREYLLKHFGAGNEMEVEVILDKISKGIDDINANKFVESIPWSRIPSKERGFLLGVWVKKAPDFLQWFTRTYCKFTIIDGKLIPPDFFSSQKILKKKLESQLAKLQYAYEHGTDTEKIGSWRQLCFTIMNYGSWVGDDLKPYIRKYVIDNKFMTEDVMNKIENKYWYKNFLERQAIESNEYVVPYILETVGAYIKGLLNLGTGGLALPFIAFVRSVGQAASKEKQSLAKLMIEEVDSFFTFLAFKNGRRTGAMMAHQAKSGRFSTMLGALIHYIILTYYILPWFKSWMAVLTYNLAGVNRVDIKINQVREICKSRKVEGCDEFLDEIEQSSPTSITREMIQEKFRKDSYAPLIELWKFLPYTEGDSTFLDIISKTLDTVTYMDEFSSWWTFVSYKLAFTNVNDLQELYSELEQESEKLNEELKEQTGQNLGRAITAQEALDEFEKYLNKPASIGLTEDVASKNPCIYDKEKTFLIYLKDGKLFDKNDDRLIINDDDKIIYYEDILNPGEANKFRKFCNGETILENKLNIDELKSLAPCFWDGLKDLQGNTIIIDQAKGDGGAKIVTNKSALLSLNVYTGSTSTPTLHTVPIVLLDDGWKFQHYLFKGNFDCDETTEFTIGDSSNLTPQSVKSQFSGYWTVVDVSQGVDGVEVIDNNEFKIWFKGGTLNGNEYPKGVFTIRKQNNKWYYVSKKTGEITDTEFTPFN